MKRFTVRVHFKTFVDVSMKANSGEEAEEKAMKIDPTELEKINHRNFELIDHMIVDNAINLSGDGEK